MHAIMKARITATTGPPCLESAVEKTMELDHEG
jgi:hypothetical protein